MKDVGLTCKELLKTEGIDVLSRIDFDVNGELKSLTFEYIIDTFMMASYDSKAIFLNALEKSIDSKDGGVEKFFESMGQLLLMTHMSNQIA